MANLKNKIISKLKALSEAKIVVKPEDYETISDKLKDTDVVKFVDEDSIEEVRPPRPKSVQPTQAEKEASATAWQKSNERPPRPKSVQPTQAEKEASATAWQKSNERPPRPKPMSEYGDEDYERASREVEHGINPEIGGDEWEEFLNISSAKGMDEGVKPKMKKSDLVEYVLKNKKSK